MKFKVINTPFYITIMFNKYINENNKYTCNMLWQEKNGKKKKDWHWNNAANQTQENFFVLFWNHVLLTCHIKFSRDHMARKICQIALSFYLINHFVAIYLTAWDPIACLMWWHFVCNFKETSKWCMIFLNSMQQSNIKLTYKVCQKITVLYYYCICFACVYIAYTE
jgi:hypothetical protein